MGKAIINEKKFLWLAASIIGLLILLPLLFLLTSSLFWNGKLTFTNFLSIFQKDVLTAILTGIFIATLVSIISVSVGCAFAFLFFKTNLFFKNILRSLLLFPLLLSPYIVTVAWTDVWFYLGLPSGIISGKFSVIFILTTIYIPLATYIIGGSLQQISASLEEAGELVANYRTVFLKMVIPLIRPALFSSFLLIFILSVSEFAVPSYLSVNVFTTEIFTQFAAFYNYPLAVTHALVLTLICLALAFPERVYLSKTPFVSIGKRSFSYKIKTLQHNKLWSLLSAVLIIILVFLPVLMLIIQAFSEPKTSFFVVVAQLMPAMKDSFLISVAGAFFITVSGLVFAIISVKYRIQMINLILLFVFAVPAIVLGMSLTKFYNTPALNFIYASPFIILIAFIGRFTFLSQNIINNNLKQIPASLGESAALLGASPFQSFTKITLPLLAESLYISFFLLLIFCVGELAVVIMIYPPGIDILSVRVFTRMANAPQSMVSSMCLVALMFVLLLIILMATSKKLLIKQQWMLSR